MHPQKSGQRWAEKVATIYKRIIISKVHLRNGILCSQISTRDMVHGKIGRVTIDGR